MIRAHRVNAAAQDDAAMISGWNIAPNLEYIIRLVPGETACAVLLYDGGNGLIATGAALVGTEQPCVLTPQTGQTVDMVDAELGWHLLLTTIGTESQREIRINPTVDLPDEIHPIYGDNDMAMARATAAIDEAAHYRDDVTATCPLGLGAGIGDIVNVSVDGVAVVGQVESITWTATPDGTPEQAVIRRYVAIAPDEFVEPTPATPPTVADDAGATDPTTSISGNVLTNDDAGLYVVAVNGLVVNVGEAIEGSNGGMFVVAANGDWSFNPGDDFGSVLPGESVDTSISYHASDGIAEAMALLTVTVSKEAGISVVYSASHSQVGSAYVTLDLPSTVEPGDVVVYVCAVAGAYAFGSTTYKASGFSFLSTYYANDTWDVSYIAHYRVMPDPVPASIQINDGYGTGLAIILNVFRGVSQTNVMDVTQKFTNGLNSYTPNTPSVTTVTDDALVVSVGALAHTDEQSPTAPDGYNMLIAAWSKPTTWGIQLMSAAKTVSSAGAEDPGPWQGLGTHSSAAWCGFTFALRPA